MTDSARGASDFGRYRLDRELGRGGMGVVYAATDLRLRRPVALKVVSPQFESSDEFVRRFAREATLLSRLNSPHVIQVLDYGEHDGRPYLATQFVPGGDVGSLLRAHGPLPPATALRICVQVADALADAHRVGIVHRDVKPGNVLLRNLDSPRPHALLCDFGIARTSDDGLTRPGMVAGTWEYLAPEVADGSPASPRSDIYALGCLLWTTLTGRPPYSGTDAAVALAHHHAPIPSLEPVDELARRLNQVLARCLAKDPADRYPDAGQLRSDLEEAAGLPSCPIVPVPVTAPATAARTSDAARRTSSRKRSVVALATVGALVTVGAAGVAIAAPWEADDRSQRVDDAAAPRDDAPVTGDLDGDGYGDVEIWFYPDESDEIEKTTWLSDGTHLVEQPVEAEMQPSTGSFEDLLGDFDGDGRFERLRAQTAGRSTKGPRDVTVHTDLSGGGTAEAEFLSVGPGRGNSPHVGDFDGDGRDDLLFVNWDLTSGASPRYHDGSERIWVTLRTDDGFSEPRDVDVVEAPLGAPINVVVADVDGDGRDDIAINVSRDGFAAVATRAMLRVLRATEAGFEPLPPVRYWNAVGLHLLAADLSGDGDEEILSVRAHQDQLQVRSFDYRSGTLSRPDPVLGLDRPEGVWPDLLVSDVNGDGADDVVAVVPSKDAPAAEIEVAVSDDGSLRQPGTWATWAANPWNRTRVVVGDNRP